MGLTERLSLLIDTVGGKAAVRDFNALETAAGNTGGTLGSLSAKTGISAEMLKTGLATGAVIAGAALVKFGVDAVEAFASLGAGVLEVQRASGATAEQASLLVAVGDDFNITAEQLGSSLFKLGKNTVQSTDDLEGFGVQVATSSDGTTDLVGTVLNVADAFKATGDPAQRAALLTAAFGKSGADLIPILEQGRQGIEGMFAAAEDTGQILSQEDIDKAEQFRLAQDELADSIAQVSLKLGQVLVPALTAAADGLSDTIGWLKRAGETADSVGDKVENFFTNLAKRAGPARGSVEKFGESVNKNLNLNTLLSGIPGGAWFSSLGDSVKAATGDVERLAGPIIDVVVGLEDVDHVAGEAARAAEAFAEAGAASAKEHVDALAEEKRQIDAVRDASIRARDASISVREAHEAVEAAVRDESEARDAYNQLLETGGVDLERVKRAQEDIVDVQKDMESALLDVVEAQEAVNRALDPAAPKDLAKGQRTLEDAQDDVTSSQISLAGAQGDLLALQMTGLGTADELALAEIRVRDAERDLADAQDRVIEKTAELNELHKVGTTESDIYKTAVSNLEGATALAATATGNFHTAQGELNTAQGVAPGYAKDLEDATWLLRDATQDAGDKTWNVEKATLAWKIALDDNVAPVDTAKGKVKEYADEIAKIPPEKTTKIKVALDDPAGVIGGLSSGGLFGQVGDAVFGRTAPPPGGAISGAVTGALVGAGPGAHGVAQGGVTVIQLVLDGKVVTEVVYNGLQAKQRQNGALGLN